MNSNSSQEGTCRSLIYIPASDTTPASLQVLDQLRLPAEIEYLPVPDVAAGWQVIHKMQIRGAPLIAIVAVLSLAMDLRSAQTQQEMQQIVAMNGDGSSSAAPALHAYIQGKLDYLATSRPTAVNLFHALKEVSTVLHQATATVTDIVDAVVAYAEQLLQQDVADCRAIGQHGADAILAKCGGSDNNNDTKVTVLTICNTGSLATAHYGTALGVVRALHARGRLEQVVALETRPYNQGSRLTCFECLQDALPRATLICDSMAAAFMKRHTQSNPSPLVVIVGADRVVANGDTANKIGTYQLAVVAQAHGVPFFVAAPTTTLDAGTPTGDDIIIEERPAAELLQSSAAPPNMPCWNPAFDVTPASFITGGILTERGWIRPGDDGTFNVPAFLNSEEEAAAASLEPPVALSSLAKEEEEEDEEEKEVYTEQTVASLPAFLAARVPAAMEVLGTDDAADIHCVEMGDGNLNLVFIVTHRQHPDRAVIVKQALPYVRCVGESWPLTLDRAWFESSALAAHRAAAPAYVPQVFFFSRPHALMVMEYIAPPRQILRKGLIQGIRYRRMAVDMGTYCAQTLFRTSGLALSATELRQQVEFWSQNHSMCGLTEQVVFTEPYTESSNNRWTSPYLDEDKKAIERDVALKVAVAGWSKKFVTHTEALIHADLHTGSVMCANEEDTNERQTYVIDPEFAFYGPAAFDTGAFIANLFLSYVSQKAHRAEGDDYEEWILQQIVVFWNTFSEQFLALWNDPKEHRGFVYHSVKEHMASDPEGPDSETAAGQNQYMRTLLQDTLGFAGMKMLRRIVGIAHVEDLESIEDLELRSRCERRGLRMARAFIVQEESWTSIEEVIALARSTPF